MNSNIATESKTQSALATDEIAYLEGKKTWATTYVLLYVFVLLFGYAMYFSLPVESGFKIILSVIITAVFLVPIVKETKKIGRISRDLRGGSKIIFTAEIEDYRQNIRADKQGNITGGDYFLFFHGEKYEVKSENFFQFGRGDTVKVCAAPDSRYIFSVEKIATAPRSDSLFHFSSPLF